MADSLPDRPDLEQLRRQAKELRDAARRGDPGALNRIARCRSGTSLDRVSLAAAQLVIARELGFPSWPKLKATIEALAASPQGRAEAFIAASVEGRMQEAATLLAIDPTVATRSVNAAVVLGDAERVREALAADRPTAVAVDEDRGWPPLLYACYSRWHQTDPDRMSSLANVARLLLDAGASPNTNNGARPHHGYRSALHGAVVANNPVIVALLLERGANPSDGESLYHAAAHRDHACLDLLLSHGATLSGTWALDVAVHGDDTAAVTRLLNAGARHGEPVHKFASDVLHDAAASASAETITALLIAGADPQSRDSRGMSALRCAVRAGNRAAAARLLDEGVSDDSTDIDRFLGACLQADRAAAEQLLSAHPQLRDQLTEEDRAAIVDAAGTSTQAAVALMLDLGFTPHDRNPFGEQPLHTAAYRGNVEIVRMLIEAGADLEATDTNFDGTPLGYATVGSGERAGQPGDWAETVQLLIEAGATHNDVWIAGKPPSEDVAAVLRRYGITPTEDGPTPHESTSTPKSIVAGVIADIAEQLQAAFRDHDLDLLASLLHPNVRWAQCTNRDEVIGWYRQALAQGTRATIDTVEVDRDTIRISISVSGQAEGATPARPEHLHQAFTVHDAQIIEIRGHPNQSTAPPRE